MTTSNPCTEHLNDVIAIYPIPVTDLTLMVPLPVSSPTVALAQLTTLTTLDTLLTLYPCFSLTPRTYAAQCFEMNENPTFRTTSSKTKAGITHTVNASMVCDTPSDSLATYLPQLLNDPHHLIIYRADGTAHFIRSSELSYSCKTTDNLTNMEKLTIDITINNVNGLQVIRS